MSHCVEWESELVLYAGGDPVDAELTRHLESCPGCRGFAREMAEEIERWKQPDAVREDAVREEDLAEVRVRVMQAIASPQRDDWSGFWRPSALWYGAAAAACLVAVWLAGSLLTQQPAQGPRAQNASQRREAAPASEKAPPVVAARDAVRPSPPRHRAPAPRPRPALQTVAAAEPGAGEENAAVIKLLTSDPDVVILLVTSNGDGE